MYYILYYIQCQYSIYTILSILYTKYIILYTTYIVPYISNLFPGKCHNEVQVHFCNNTAAIQAIAKPII